MKAEEFDQAFDRGEDVTSALDLAAARRPGLEQRRVNVDFPVWMIESLDREARRLGVTRQAVIKVWIAEHLERRDSAAALRSHPRPDRRQQRDHARSSDRAGALPEVARDQADQGLGIGLEWSDPHPAAVTYRCRLCMRPAAAVPCQSQGGNPACQ
jgi:hypothetical protein